MASIRERLCSPEPWSLPDHIGDREDHDLYNFFNPGNPEKEFVWILFGLGVSAGGSLFLKNLWPESVSLLRRARDLALAWGVVPAIRGGGLLCEAIHLDTYHYDRYRDHGHLAGLLKLPLDFGLDMLEFADRLRRRTIGQSQNR